MSVNSPASHHIALIGLGSNVKPRQHLLRAVVELAKQTQILEVSSAWKSPAIGSNGPDFLNAAVKVVTELPADELKTAVLRPIEAGLGRVRGSDPNAPRTIDLDILVFDGKEMDRQIWDFVYLVMPLSEIESSLTSSITGETVAEATIRLSENQKIKKTKLKLL